jgi:uncharacterized protein YjiS (DUF1127 family)
MTTTDYSQIPAALPERRPFAPAKLLRRWWAAQRQQRQMRRDMQELYRLDGYLLRDIGLSHTDLRDALRGRRYSAWIEPPRRDDGE